MRRAALVLTLFLLAAPSALAAGRLHVVLKGQDHHPKVGGKWHYDVWVTDGKTHRPVTARVHLQFLFGTFPVGQIGVFTAKNGHWGETIGTPGNPPFPPASRGQRLTIQAIAMKKGYAKATAGWWIVPR